MRRYLSNMRYSQYDIVVEAIRRSGRQDLHIDPDPIPADN